MDTKPENPESGREFPRIAEPVDRTGEIIQYFEYVAAMRGLRRTMREFTSFAIFVCTLIAVVGFCNAVFLKGATFWKGAAAEWVPLVIIALLCVNVAFPRVEPTVLLLAGSGAFLVIRAVLYGLLEGDYAAVGGILFGSFMILLGFRLWKARQAYRQFLGDSDSSRLLSEARKLFEAVLKARTEDDPTAVEFTVITFIDKYAYKGKLLADVAVLAPSSMRGVLVVRREDICIQADAKVRRRSRGVARMTIKGRTHKVLISAQSRGRIEQWIEAPLSSLGAPGVANN